VSPCSASPCLNDGSCTVDVNGEAVCACNGNEENILFLNHTDYWNTVNISLTPCLFVHNKS
jgi:hypothetical protein